LHILLLFSIIPAWLRIKEAKSTYPLIAPSFATVMTLRLRHSWMPLSSRYPSFLNASIRNPNNRRGCSYGSKKKKAKTWIPA